MLPSTSDTYISISSFAMVFDTTEQQNQRFHPYLQALFNTLNNIVLTFFTSALTFSMSQVSGTYLHKHKKRLRKLNV